ncbi:MAG TPA: hemolysin family protein [Terriglobales bacterium]|nr:hemolysin family protein [Terriglobales bacterium]
MTVLLAVLLVVLLAILALVSYVDRVYTEMGKFLSREFQENIEIYEKQVEPRLGVSRERAALSVAVLSHISLAAIALLVGYAMFADGVTSVSELAQGTVSLVLIVIVFNRLLPFVFFTRTKGEWLVPFVWPLRLLIYLVMPVTLVLGFCLSVVALAEEHEPEEPEHPSEAVEALIEAGQEEGILQESDRELIQSVVEFGEKTVREVMTPRPEIVAVPVDTTVEQFTELLRTKPYSRVPVYQGSIDNIQGIVFAHDVLQVPDAEARTRTVRELMKPAYFVPESQRVSSLLREMQKENTHMAIVVDEYGGTAGVVTIEDLVEEIVGEIRDEHEAEADIVRESDNSYIVPGSMDVDRLEKLFHVRPEEREATTVAGLVSEILGRIPEQGEVVEDNGLRFEILESTDRRVERLRISARKSSH